MTASAIAQSRMWRPGPLAGRYPATAGMVVLFLVPYLGLSSALPAITPTVGADLHMSAQALSLTGGMANAGYAVGTVLAVQFAQHLPQRRMLLGYAALLVIGSILAASAIAPWMFITGHVLQGLCTSLLLIAAAPPLFLSFPTSKLRPSAMIMNICLFGAVTAGPLIGGAQASFAAWRPLFWIVAGVAGLALLLSLLTFQDAPAADRSAPRDGLAIGLAAAGSVAAFWGASELLTHRFLDPVVIVPLLGGLALIVALWIYQYRARNPLLTLRSLNSTIPVSGIVVAVCAAAASTSAIALTTTVLAPRYEPLHLGLLFIPEMVAAILASVVFGLVFGSRLIHYLALVGMACLAAGVAVLSITTPPSSTLTLIGSGLVGVGIGASVTPALFLVGFSIRSAGLQRVFAILELLRAVAAFLVGPILVHFATTLTGQPTPAMHTTLQVCFWLAVGGGVLAVVLYLLGGARATTPDLEGWREGPGPAWYSPPLFALLRTGRAARVLHANLPRLSTGAHGGLLAHANGHRAGHAAPHGAVLFAYDGSGLARAAIAEAGRQLGAGRDALVVTVWRTFNVGFVPELGMTFDAARGDEVRVAAERTAQHGAALAEAAGFRARSRVTEGSSTAKAIIDAADAADAGLIVLGSHGRAGFGGRLVGSVAEEVAGHTQRAVLIVHGHEAAPASPEVTSRPALGAGSTPTG